MMHLYRYFVSRVGLLTPCFVPSMRIFVHNDCPGRRVFAPFKSCPGFVAGGGGEGLDEIDTCISHRHVKSNIARPTSVDQVIHASLKMCRIFLITKHLWIKTILSVVQLVRLCQCSPPGRSFPGKERYYGEI